MRNDRYSLHVPASIAIGDEFPCQDMLGKTFQVSGTFTATINLEGTINGTDWVVLEAGLTTGTIIRLVDTDGNEPTLWRIRCRTTAYTIGTPAVTLIGHGRAAE
jgi:hypothetical protein